MYQSLYLCFLGGSVVAVNVGVLRHCGYIVEIQMGMCCPFLREETRPGSQGAAQIHLAATYIC